MMMFPQHPMGQRPVSQQFDGAVEVPFQPFGGDAGVRMIIQCFVDAGDGFHLLQHGADVVADEDDGAVVVDFGEELVEACFETLVDVGAGFVENQYGGVGDDGAAKQGTLQLSTAKLSDGAAFEAFETHAGDDLSTLFPLFGGEAGGEGLLDAEAGEDDFFDGNREFPVDGAVLRQVAEEKWRVGSGGLRGAAGRCGDQVRGVEDDFSSCGFQQAEDALDKGGLSAAVGADDTQEITVVDA